jgi:hypothetical protein
VRWGLVVIAAVVLMLMVVITLPAFAQTGDGAGSGQEDDWDEDGVEGEEEVEGQAEGDTQGGGADSLGTGPGPRRGRSGGRDGRADETVPELTGSWFWDTHPDLGISISKRKDVTNWDTKIALRRQVSPKFSFNLSAALHPRENSTLNRSDSNDNVTAGLKYAINDAISFGLKYNSNVNAFRYNLDRRDPDERKGKQNFTVSAEFSKFLYPGVDVSFSTNAGATQNSYASVSNQGRQGDIAASISYSPNSSLRTSVSYTARSMLLDAQVDSAGVVVFTSVDRTLNEDLSLTASYDFMPGFKINFDASQSDRTKQHPDPARREQETERRSSRRAGIKMSFDRVRRFTWDVSVALNDSKNQFDLQENRDNSARRASINGSAKLLPWRGATINLGGTSEQSRNTYETPDTGRDVHNSLSLKLSQNLGPKADVNLTALSDMTQVFYDNKSAETGNPNDRDRVNNRVSMDLNYKPGTNINTRLSGEYSDERSVYIMPSKSYSNRTTRKYRISGSYDIKTYRNIGVKQDYDISAVYTFYQYGEGRNTLLRNSNIKTRFNLPIAKGVNVNVNHQFKFQDQGGYREVDGQRLYARSAERETNIFAIVFRYNPISNIRFSLRQSYQLQRNWRYTPQGFKVLDYEVPTLELSGRIGLNYKFGDRTKVSLVFEQNRREGSRVSEAFRRYSNIEFEASHVF